MDGPDKTGKSWGESLWGCIKREAENYKEMTFARYFECPDYCSREGRGNVLPSDQKACEVACKRFQQMVRAWELKDGQ